MKFMAVVMFKKGIISIIIFILIITMGCTLSDPSEGPSYSVFPKMILDYDLDDEQIKVWVKSAIGDFKYDYMKMELLNKNYTERIEENNTYFIQISTELDDFNLTIQVITEEKIFDYACHISLLIIDEEISVSIWNFESEKEEIFLLDDLPYKNVLEENV
jgi:hypothetical protein